MGLKIKLYHRVVALVLAFTFVFPLIPFRYIDLEFRYELAKI